jgi:hypothetical protein
MIARDVESMLLSCCPAVTREAAPKAQDRREANVFRLAAMIARPQFPRESGSSIWANEQYFVEYPDERLVSAELVRNDWISSPPHLRDMLSQRFAWTSS